jgi:hypothetical protein
MPSPALREEVPANRPMTDLTVFIRDVPLKL